MRREYTPRIAPDAAHAQHMPSHIFTRVGYWQESIDSNKVAQRVAKDASDFHDQLHAMDYQVYAYLQLGQDGKAKALLDEMPSVTGFTETFLVGPYALAVSPARYAIERGDWKAAASLEVRPSPLSQVQAITYFARALGAARSGNPEAAKPDIAKLVELRDKLREAKDGYWSEQVDIQQKVASAWVLYAEGKYDDALTAMSAAADAEDKTEKHPVTPGVPTPARELYGVMLLDRGKPTEALVAFEATLKKEPNRLHAYVGAAKAAEKSGNSAKAREYYGKVVQIAANADTDPHRSRRCAHVSRVDEASVKTGRRDVVRAVVQLILLGALVTPAGAEPLELFGYAGVLGEWELTASVRENGGTKDLVGPLTMTHVGICTVDSPEEKKGEIRLQISQPASRMSATLVLDGVECTYSGRLSDFYSGTMNCPARAPVPLKIWLK